MNIQLEIGFSFKRDLETGYQRLELRDEATVAEAIEAFVRKHPAARERIVDSAGGIKRHINALINGGNVTSREGFETVLRAGDRLTLLPPVGGG